MWQSRTKYDLMIEVWEKLDCESIGAEEIIAIEAVVLDQYGKAAVETPMQIARLLADEGAELRHSEIMQLYVERASDQPYEAAFRNILDVSGFREAAASIKDLENLRRKYKADGDKEGLRLIREEAQQARRDKLTAAEDVRKSNDERAKNAEIAEWLTLWMQSPEMFETWVKLRQASADFKAKFI